MLRNTKNTILLTREVKMHFYDNFFTILKSTHNQLLRYRSLLRHSSQLRNKTIPWPFLITSQLTLSTDDDIRIVQS